MAITGVFIPWKLVNFFLNFIFGCIGSSLPCRLFSSCHEPGDTFLLWYMGFSCCGTQSLGHVGFSSCSSWAPKLQFLCSRAEAQQLWHTGLVTPQQVGASRMRNATCVSCTVSWSLYSWVIREALGGKLLFFFRELVVKHLPAYHHLRRRSPVFKAPWFLLWPCCPKQ